MYFHTSRISFPTWLFVSSLLLSIALPACGGVQSTPTTSAPNAVISWPFDPHDGKWAIVNGYRGNEDHALGASPNNYALFALDFAKCLPGKVITSQRSEASCDLLSGWANTVGSAVYSPVSGNVAWSDESCHGLSMDIDGQSGYRVVLFHIDPLPGISWSQLASSHTHFNQGDKIGTVSAGGCIGSGNHIHMALYSCMDCSSDPASQRVGQPFSGSWSISNTPFPDDGNTTNEYLSLLVPIQHLTVSTPPSTTIPAPAPTPTPSPTLVDVQAVSDWQDTGIFVSQGTVVTIEYVSGYWRPWPGVDFDGRGCTQGCDPVTHNLIVGCDHGGLIGRIGSSQMICILNGTTAAATESGNLYLRINDDKQDDDSGAITVRITLG